MTRAHHPGSYLPPTSAAQRAPAELRAPGEEDGREHARNTTTATGTRSVSRAASTTAGRPGSTGSTCPGPTTAPPSCADRVTDQAALHGLLHKLRDIGLPLLSVARIDPRLSVPTSLRPTRTHQEIPMTTSTSAPHRAAAQHPDDPDATRRHASSAGCSSSPTSRPSSAKVAFYPPLFDGNYVTGPGQDTRVLWGAFSECSSSSPTSAPPPRCTRSSSAGTRALASASSPPASWRASSSPSASCASSRVVTLRQDYAGADAAVRGRPGRRRRRLPRHAAVDLQPRPRVRRRRRQRPASSAT